MGRCVFGRLMLLAFAAPVAAFITPAPALRGSDLVQRSTSSSTSLLCMMARRPMIAGNWKMNPDTVQEAETLAKAVAAAASTSPAQVAIMVPYVYLYAAGQIFKGTNVELGAESVFFEQKGAYTEAVSSCQVKSTGAVHCLAGHSEERVIFKADDAWINKQVKAIIVQGLNPLLCIGESKDEYEGKLNTAVCAVQLSKGLKGVTKEEMKRVTIAYEPVWAIGTGLTCDPDTAQSVHNFIREWLAKMYDQTIADNVRILYGGSVTPETVDDLMTRPDIDGCLVGGASLDAAKFSRIMNFQSRKAFDARAGVKDVANSKIKNANPDDFFTYMAKRMEAEQAARLAKNPIMSPSAMSDFSVARVKNANPDDFSTYMAKRKAAENGVAWFPGYK